MHAWQTLNAHPSLPKLSPVSACVSGKLANVILVYEVSGGRRMLRPKKPCCGVVPCTSQYGIRARVEVDVVRHIVHLHTYPASLGAAERCIQQPLPIGRAGHTRL